MTLDEYLDAAIRTAGLSSDRQLANAIGLQNASVSWYRTKRAWPDDATMIKLAELAGVNQTAALVDLNSWRAKSPQVRLLYRELAMQLARLMIATVFFLGILHAPAGAAVGTGGEHWPFGKRGSIHYATIMGGRGDGAWFPLDLLRPDFRPFPVRIRRGMRMRAGGRRAP